MEYKRFSAELKSEEGGAPEGSFRAVFSTFGVVDHDGDITLPTAFEKGAGVRLAAWGHNWGVPTIGRGVLDADDSKAWIDGQFNLAMPSARDTYEAVKFNADIQEWSYGFEITASSRKEQDGEQIRILEGCKVFEVSPVLLGAGIGTHTESIKTLSGELDASILFALLRKECEGLEVPAADALAADLIALAETLRRPVEGEDSSEQPKTRGTPLTVLRARMRRDQHPDLVPEGVRL